MHATTEIQLSPQTLRVPLLGSLGSLPILPCSFEASIICFCDFSRFVLISYWKRGRFVEVRILVFYKPGARESRRRTCPGTAVSLPPAPGWAYVLCTLLVCHGASAEPRSRADLAVVVVLVVVMAVAASATAHLGRLQLFQLRPHVVLLQEMCANIIKANTVTATSFLGLRYGHCTSSLSFS